MAAPGEDTTGIFEAGLEKDRQRRRPGAASDKKKTPVARPVFRLGRAATGPGAPYRAVAVPAGPKQAVWGCTDESAELAVLCARKDWEILKQRIAEGASVHGEEPRGRCTALHWAAYYGGREPLRLLLDAGADMHCMSSEGIMASHAAARAGQLGVLLDLWRRDPTQLAEADVDGTTPAHYAAQKGFIHILEWLYLRGAPMHDADVFGFTPLHWAVHEGRMLATQLLLRVGGRFCTGTTFHKPIRDVRGRTPLHWIALKSRFTLLDTGLRVAPLGLAGEDGFLAKDRDGRTPVSFLGRCWAPFASCQFKVGEMWFHRWRTDPRLKGSGCCDAPLRHPCAMVPWAMIALVNFVNTISALYAFLLPHRLNPRHPFGRKVMAIVAVGLSGQAIALWHWICACTRDPGFCRVTPRLGPSEPALAEAEECLSRAYKRLRELRRRQAGLLVDCHTWRYTPPDEVMTMQVLKFPQPSSQQLDRVLNPGDTFEVCEEVVGEKAANQGEPPQRFLRLAGEPGWVVESLPGVGRVCSPCFVLHQRLQVKDDQRSNWQEGSVTSRYPLKIRPDGWEEDHCWDYVRQHPKDERDKIVKELEASIVSARANLSKKIAFASEARQRCYEEDYLQYALSDKATADPRTWGSKACVVCGRLRKDRSKHCKDCGRCVSRFDHHCPWINNCVGRGNVIHFIFFLAWTMASLLVCEVFWWCVLAATPNRYWWDWSPWWRLGVKANMLCNVGWIIFSAVLLFRQLCLALIDHTEYEIHQGKGGCCKVFCGASAAEVRKNFWRILVRGDVSQHRAAVAADPKKDADEVEEEDDSPAVLSGGGRSGELRARRRAAPAER